MLVTYDKIPQNGQTTPNNHDLSDDHHLQGSSSKNANQQGSTMDSPMTRQSLEMLFRCKVLDPNVNSPSRRITLTKQKSTNMLTSPKNFIKLNIQSMKKMPTTRHLSSGGSFIKRANGMTMNKLNQLGSPSQNDQLFTTFDKKGTTDAATATHR